MKKKKSSIDIVTKQTGINEFVISFLDSNKNPYIFQNGNEAVIYANLQEIRGSEYLCFSNGKDCSDADMIAKEEIEFVELEGSVRRICIGNNLDYLCKNDKLDTETVHNYFMQEILLYSLQHLSV